MRQRPLFHSAYLRADISPPANPSLGRMSGFKALSPGSGLAEIHPVQPIRLAEAVIAKQSGCNPLKP
jgi:hypothetical protein